MRDDTNSFDDGKSILYSFSLETNRWSTPQTNGLAPGRKRQMNGVISNKTRKFYVFGGFNDTNNTVLKDMNIFDIISSTWLKGSTEGSPSSRMGYTATLLSNGIIVYIGGRESYLNEQQRDADINQLPLYDTKIDQWSLMRARGTLENRYSHSAVLTPDERIIIFGGNTNDLTIPVLNQLAVLDTKVNPYEWSIPKPAPPLPLTINLHSATLVGNYMFVNFGKIYVEDKSKEQLPYFYILDIRDFTWVTQYEPEQHPQTPNNSKQIGIIIGVSLGVGIVAGLLGYVYYKKQRVHKHAKQAEQCVSYN
ncbi:galactose oxidase [Rhizophagus irregularis]|uniref:Galactose oxidase n=1 Tax=Rhizophagus irregularis TaxID=588596 RepID=A0A2I1GJJ9_9GLOM|nr:galactose oxidase [Rhizophagus irregularis]